MREAISTADLSSAQRALVLRQLRRTIAAGAGASPADDRPQPRRPDAGPAPASFVQEQLWCVHHLAPDVPMHNITFEFTLAGPLDVAALQAAWAALLDRHEVLSARLVLAGGALVQDIGPANASLPMIDMPGATTEQRAAASAQRARALAATRFDLATGPLLRAEVHRIDQHRHALTWVAHHAVIDGWSVGVLIGELQALYRAALVGARARLPVPVLRFGDVAAWQRGRLAGKRLDRLRDHWRRSLDGAVPTQLPPDRPRPPAQTFRGGMVRFEVPAAVAATVHELAATGAGTPFMTLLAAFQAVLAALTGHGDVVVGTPVAGRGRAELDEVVGPLSDTLPLRVAVDAQASFAALVGQVQDRVLDVAAHQGLPFSRLVETTRGRRDAGRNPLFQVLFNMGNLPQGTGPVPLAPGLELRPRPVPNGTVRLDVELTMEPEPGRLAGRLEYNSDLYSADHAHRLVETYLGALAAAVSRPQAPVAEVSAGSAAPRSSPPGARLAQWLG